MGSLIESVPDADRLARIFAEAAAPAFLLAGVAATRPSPRITLPRDHSYGIYIHGFLIQQCVAHDAPGITSYPGLLLSISLAVALAALRWHGLERHMLGFARTLSRRFPSRRDATDAASA
jgi:peptidoglycan/LPS O-acetylase OafA/YrhL